MLLLKYALVEIVAYTFKIYQPCCNQRKRATRKEESAQPDGREPTKRAKRHSEKRAILQEKSARPDGREQAETKASKNSH